MREWSTPAHSERERENLFLQLPLLLPVRFHITTPSSLQQRNSQSVRTPVSFCCCTSMGGHSSLSGKETKFSSSRIFDTEERERENEAAAKFTFGSLHNSYTDLSDSLEKQVDISSSLPGKSSCWPQSYEKCMNLYSRSFESLSCLQQDPFSSSWFPAPAVNKTADVEEPLLSNAWENVDYARSYIHKSSEEFPVAVRTFSQNGDAHTVRGSPPGSSVLQASFNAMNILAGVGILSMPYAISEGGWLGLSFLFIFAAVCCYTGVLLCRCLEANPKLSSYPDIGQAALGNYGRILISVLLYAELYAVSVEFLILEGDNLTELFSWDGLCIGFISLPAKESFILLSALVMLPSVWLRDLSLLSYISACGVAACIAVLLAVAWVGFFDLGFSVQGPLLNVKGLPVAVGLYAFCYCGHPVLPNIYCSMKDKAKFSQVLITCFMLCTLLYGGMAVLGYLMFGESVESQVALSLPKGNFATTFAILATLVSPFAKYALILTPLAAALEEFLPRSWTTKSSNVSRIIIRTLLVASTVVVARTVPFFADLMALIGSFLNTSVGIIIPSVCFMKIFAGRISLRETMLIFVILFIGLSACIAGTYSSIREIVISLSE